MKIQRWTLLENLLRHWLYRAGDLTKLSKNLTEGQGQMSMTSCLTTLKSLKLPEMEIFSAEERMMKDQTSQKVFSAMNVKVLVISNQNAQHFLRSKRRG